MTFERYLENYADLIVKFALALKPGDKTRHPIQCGIACPWCAWSPAKLTKTE